MQFARARGARVIGTASEGNHEFLRSLGAEPTTYGDGLVERVRALAPDGVDLAFDTAGHGALPELIEITGDPAQVGHDRRLQRRRSSACGSTGGGGRRAPGALGEAASCRGRARSAAGDRDLPVRRRRPRPTAISEDGHVRGKLVLVPG